MEGINNFEDHLGTIKRYYELARGIERAFELTGQPPIFDPSAGIFSESGDDFRPFRELLPKTGK
jgi:hypothetical protein